MSSLVEVKKAEPRQGRGMGQRGNPQHVGIGRGRLAPNAFPGHANAFIQPGGNIPMAGSGAPHQFGGFGRPVTVGHNQLPYGGGYGPVPNGALSFCPPVTVLGHNQLPNGGGYGPVPNGAQQWYTSNDPQAAMGMAEPRQGRGMGQMGNPQHFGIGRGRLAPNVFPGHAYTFFQSGGSFPPVGSGALQQFGSFGPPVTVGHNQVLYGGGYGQVPNVARQRYGSNDTQAAMGMQTQMARTFAALAWWAAMAALGYGQPPYGVGHSQGGHGQTGPSHGRQYAQATRYSEAAGSSNPARYSQQAGWSGQPHRGLNGYQ